MLISVGSGTKAEPGSGRAALDRSAGTQSIAHELLVQIRQRVCPGAVNERCSRV